MTEAKSRCVAVIVETEGGPVVVVVLWPADDDARPAPSDPTPASGGGWSLDLSDEP
jgi:hypothetical protein